MTGDRLRGRAASGAAHARDRRDIRLVGDTPSVGPEVDAATRSRARLRRLTIGILAVGFTSALVIYLTAGAPGENPLGYDPLETKKYLHDLEVYGGRANVLAAQFRAWFVDLWQGQNLAFTVAVITVLLVLAIRFFATLPPPEADDTGDPEAGD
jgi:hypothetical protein